MDFSDFPVVCWLKITGVEKLCRESPTIRTCFAAYMQCDSLFCRNFRNVGMFLLRVELHSGRIKDITKYLHEMHVYVVKIIN